MASSTPRLGRLGLVRFRSARDEPADDSGHGAVVRVRKALNFLVHLAAYDQRHVVGLIFRAAHADEASSLTRLGSSCNRY